MYFMLFLKSLIYPLYDCIMLILLLFFDYHLCVYPGAMDTFARALKVAADMKLSGVLDQLVKVRDLTLIALTSFTFSLEYLYFMRSFVEQCISEWADVGVDSNDGSLIYVCIVC